MRPILASALLLVAAVTSAGDRPVWTFELGQTLPSGTLTDLSGQQVELPPVGGGPVLINIFATWCVPCRQEIPQIEKQVWQRYQGRGLRVYGIDRGEPAEVVGSFVRAIGVTYPVLLDRNRRYFGSLSGDGRGIPKSLLLDSTGRVVWRENGFFPGETIPDLEARLRELLPPPPAGGN